MQHVEREISKASCYVTASFNTFSLPVLTSCRYLCVSPFYRCDWSVQECRGHNPYYHQDQQGSLQEDPQPNGHQWQSGGRHIVGGGGNN